LNATFCIDCEAGKFSLESASLCSVCAKGSIQPLTGQSTCSVCGTAADTDDSYTECLCLAGYVDINNNRSNANCVACPSGGNCVDVGAMASQLLPLTGHWPVPVPCDDLVATSIPTTSSRYSFNDTTWQVYASDPSQSLANQVAKNTSSSISASLSLSSSLSPLSAYIPSAYINTFTGVLTYTDGVTSNCIEQQSILTMVLTRNITVTTSVLVATVTWVNESLTRNDSGQLTYDASSYPLTTLMIVINSTVYVNTTTIVRDCSIIAATSTSDSYNVTTWNVTSTSTHGRISSVRLHTIYQYCDYSDMKFLTCSNGACIGGNGTCDEGYEGSLCSVCSDGYERKNVDECNECPSSAISWIKIIFSAIGISLVCGLVSWIGIYTARNQGYTLRIRLFDSFSYVYFRC
jgi:hypothetical protein